MKAVRYTSYCDVVQFRRALARMRVSLRRCLLPVNRRQLVCRLCFDSTILSFSSFATPIAFVIKQGRRKIAGTLAQLGGHAIEITSPTVPDLALARRLVFAHSWNPIAYQILNPGIQHWFSQQRDAVIGYVTCNHIRVVAGTPVCSPTRISQIIEEFEADAACERHGVCYFNVGLRFVGVVNNSPNHSIAAIGALPFWDPTRWDAVLRSSSSLRSLVKCRPPLPPRHRTCAIFGNTGSTASTYHHYIF